MSESLDKDKIYSSRLVFRRNSMNEKILTIHIKFHKKNSGFEKKLLFPEHISEDELSWFRYRDSSIAVYQRQNNSNGKTIYTDSQNCIAPIYLTHRFEEIFLKTLQHYKIKTN